MAGAMSTDLLVSEDVASDVAFSALDELDVGLHALRGERIGEQVADVSVRVKAGELMSAVSVGLNMTLQRLTVMNCQT